MPLIVNDRAVTEEYLRANRFTDDAVYVVRDAVQRFCSRGFVGLVPQVMLLWSMVNWEKKMGLATIEHCGIEKEAVRQDVCIELTRWKVDTSQQNLDLRSLSEVNTLACSISRDRNDDYVGTEHLVLALCKSTDAIVRRIFGKHGVTYQSIELALRELL